MNENNSSIVAANIKTLRSYFGYTQEDLAEKIGVGRSAYANYELGEREMPYDVISKLSTVFGCDAYMLFDEKFSVHNDVLVCAFRMNNIDKQDFDQVCHFKDVVRSYLKMKRIADE